MSDPLLVSPTCKDCFHFRRVQGVQSCIKNPPAGQMLLVPGQAPGTMEARKFTLYPSPEPDWPACGSYRSRLSN